MAFIALSICIGYTSGEHPKEYTSDWAVHLKQGVDPSFLKQHGFEYIGKIANFDNIFLLRHKETHARSLNGKKFEAAHDVTFFLNGLEHVEWTEQQYLKSFTPKAVFPDPLYPNQWHLNNLGQGNGTVGVDVSVQAAWNLGYTGNGVRIAVLDDGFQYTHPDLAPGYQADSSANFLDGNPNDPMPTGTTNAHGTAAAGVALARNNSACGVGAAFMAQGAGIRLLGGSTTDAQNAAALSFKNQLNHIYSCSYGPSYPFQQNYPIGTLEAASILNSVKTGRGGLGSIYVWASGNEAVEGGDCNQALQTNNLNVITVGAVDNRGIRADYSNPGACVHITSPSGSSRIEITTTDLMGSGGYDPTDCTNTYSGTSSATPLVSGVIALMLEANPLLTYRDVKEVIARTATKTDPTDSDWVVNGGGLNVNHKYGFGRINASAAVIASKTWKTLPAQFSRSFTVTVNQPVPDYPATGVSATFTVPDAFVVENVELSVGVNHSYSGDIAITLRSPFGTTDILSFPHGTQPSLSGAGFANIEFPAIRKNGFGPQFFPTITAALKSAGSDDGCDGSYTGCNTFNGAVVVVDTGSCDSAIPVRAAQACGARGVIFVQGNDSPQPSSGGAPAPTIPSAAIGTTNGAALRALIQNGVVNVNFAFIKYETNGYSPSFALTSIRHWGENSTGTWTMTVTDGYAGDVGTFVGAELEIFGRSVNSTAATTAAATATTAAAATATTTTGATTTSIPATTAATGAPVVTTGKVTSSASFIQVLYLGLLGSLLLLLL